MPASPKPLALVANPASQLAHPLAIVPRSGVTEAVDSVWQSAAIQQPGDGRPMGESC